MATRAGRALVVLAVLVAAAVPASAAVTWTPVTSVPSEKFGQTVVRGSDGFLYALSDAWGGTPEVYDPATDMWQPLPSPPLTIDGAWTAAAGNDGRIFAFEPAPGRSVLAYAPATRSWSTERPQPIARTAPVTVTGRQGRIFLIGGYDTSATSPSTAVEAYTPSTNSWQSRAPVPTPHYFGAGTLARDGDILVMGGYASYPYFSGAPSTAAEAYHPQTNTWRTLRPMGIARSGTGAAVGADGRIYLPGGLTTGARTLTSVAVYDPANNSWTPGPALPTARHGAGIVSDGQGNIYAVGGQSASDPCSCTVLRLAPNG